MTRGYSLVRVPLKGRIADERPRAEKSVEAMQALRDDLTFSKEKALAFLVEAGIVTAVVAIDCQRRDVRRQVRGVDDIAVRQLLLVENRYGNRHVLKIFLRTPGGDDDLSEFVATIGRCRPGRYHGCRKKIGYQDGQARQKQATCSLIHPPPFFWTLINSMWNCGIAFEKSPADLIA